MGIDYDEVPNLISKWIPESTVYVPVLLGDLIGGRSEVLGVYLSRSMAEARLYRKLVEIGFDNPTEILVITLNSDNDMELELPDPNRSRSERYNQAVIAEARRNAEKQGLSFDPRNTL